jgi:zinc transport system substrate-binding protein
MDGGTPRYGGRWGHLAGVAGRITVGGRHDGGASPDLLRPRGVPISLGGRGGVAAASAAAVAAVLAGAVSCSPRPCATAGVVVTSALIECLARELVAGEEGIEVVSILPPGSCPGHFDLAPSALPALRSAALVLRHDFQGALDAKMASLGASNVASVAVSSHGSLLVPGNYLTLARETAAALARRFPEREARFRERLSTVEARVSAIEGEILAGGRPWKGARAIASAHQKDFALWLGLEVAGTLARPEDVTPVEFRRLVESEASLVVANLQEGRDAASALAAKKGVPAAVFSNFPGVEGYGATYEDLVRANVRRLATAWASR